MSKTTKRTLMKELEKSIVLNNPELVDVVIVEGMLFLDLPETCGFVRSSILKSILLFSQKD